jgi:acylphosphatase
MAGDVVRHIRVLGRVQGVGYRAWVEDTALTLGLKGWVRNRRDGSVEAVFQGEPGRVAEMLKRCAEGPRMARVTRVETLDEPQSAVAYRSFEVRGTA